MHECWNSRKCSRTFRKDPWELVYNWLKHLLYCRMLISARSIDGNDVAAAPCRVSRLLNPSRSLVTIALLHYKRCTARKRATATHKHTSLVLRIVNLEEYGDKPTQAANLDRRSWALARDVGIVETRYRRRRRGEATIPSATTGLRHTGRSDSNNGSGSA